MLGLHPALSLFTAIPVPSLSQVNRDVTRSAIRVLPWVGLLLGLVAGAVGWLVLWAGASALLASGLTQGLLAAATGGFHLDGVADVADGLGSRAPREKALDIMKRSDIGPMDVISLVFVVLLGLGALTSLAETGISALTWVLLVALGPTVGRFAVVVTSTPRIPGARPGGFGALVAGVSSPLSVVLNGVVLLAICAPTGWFVGGALAAVALGLALLVAVGWAWLWARHLAARFGGLTGDCFGSLIETTCVAWWVLAALAVAVV